MQELLTLVAPLVVVANAPARTGEFTLPEAEPVEHRIEFRDEHEFIPETQWVPLLNEDNELHEELRRVTPGDRLVFEIDQESQIDGFIAAMKLIRDFDARAEGEAKNRFPRVMQVFDPGMVLTRDNARAMIALGAVINVETRHEFHLALNP